MHDPDEYVGIIGSVEDWSACQECLANVLDKPIFREDIFALQGSEQIQKSVHADNMISQRRLDTVQKKNRVHL